MYQYIYYYAEQHFPPWHLHQYWSNLLLEYQVGGQLTRRGIAVDVKELKPAPELVKMYQTRFSNC
jgi:hypothetical protein